MERIYTKHLKEMKGSHEEFTLIDVLSKKSFIEEHIPGSINVPFENNEQFVQAVEKIVPDKNHKVVVYCSNEMCTASLYAATALDEAGFSSVMQYRGGIKEWKEAEEPLASGKERKRAG